MSLQRSWALFRHEMRITFADPGVLVFLIFMPVLFTTVMKPLFQLSLNAEGFSSASGAEQAVPGMAAMFAGFSAAFAGFTFFREHGWATWDRLRASSATTLDIMVGKLAPPFVITTVQIFTLFGVGVILLDLNISGSLVGLAVVVVAFAMSMLSFGLAITALSRTSLQLNTYANLGAIVFAVIGGAMVPTSVLPSWVQTLGHFTPTFWAMDGLLGVVLDGDGVVDVVRPTLILLLFTAGFAAIAALKFRVEETKIFYG